MGVANRVIYGQKRLGERRAEQLITDRTANGIVNLTIKALAANRAPVYVGDREVTERTGYELSAGAILPSELLNAGILFVFGTREEGICWYGEKV